MINKFEVGDKIKAIKNICFYNTKDKFGTIKSVQQRCPGSDYDDYCVEFDEVVISNFRSKHKAHTCQGRCKDGHGLFCWEDDLVKVKL